LSLKSKHQMKNKILLVIALFALTFNVMAQTNAPTTPADFLANAKDYLTSINTNLTWDNTKMDLWTAANYQGGLQTSAEIGASYDLWKPVANIAVAPEVVFRNAGIAGTIVSGAAGVGASYEYYSLKITGCIDGGYSPAQSKPFAEFGARLKKKMTTSTYIGTGLSWSTLVKSTPSIAVYLGWTF
jgi:hypothetical protein